MCEIGESEIECEQDDDRNDVEPRMRKRPRDDDLSKCHNRIECVLANVAPGGPFVGKGSVRKSAPKDGYRMSALRWSTDMIKYAYR